MIALPSQINKVLEILENNGHEAYIVGGCVRDFLMGSQPHDWDVTTSASPSEIKDAFSGYKTIDTGIKHGTVTVIMQSMPVEITTFRIDGEYTDNRHPDDVKFTKNIQEAH